MMEEPYRWVEAVANRREYVEQQLAGGSPIAAVSCREGILLLTLGRQRRKLFEIYDRIAMGAIGHPGDIERLRMGAIELASSEGFLRSAADVSLRRLADFGLSPLLKNSFEQVCGPPFLVRMLFAEVGRDAGSDVFLRMEYDGASHLNGGGFGGAFEHYGVVAGSVVVAGRMEHFLRSICTVEMSWEEAVGVLFHAWVLGDMGSREEKGEAEPAEVRVHALERLAVLRPEVALLERSPQPAMAWRMLPTEGLRGMMEAGLGSWVKTGS